MFFPCTSTAFLNHVGGTGINTNKKAVINPQNVDQHFFEWTIFTRRVAGEHTFYDRTNYEKLEKWSKKTRFIFSPEKLSSTIFTKEKKVRNFQITVDKTIISKKNLTKLLGVLFDRWLLWTLSTKYLKTTISIIIHKHTKIIIIHSVCR